ncbi:MAG: carbamoyl phosphate synthase small subunit [Oscillospiraceae bacterium]|nr:carbamoyl phosphate synthase small subunit [Oscillospiraceae bacterium]
MKKAYLVLEDGQVFEGLRFGAETDALGELVFTTGMCSYLETLTDPSYAGQIVMQTFPLIGNYGLIPADFEGESHLRGYVVREVCDSPSNFRSEGTLDTYLKARGIPGLCGVDTRALTRLVREKGVMNACICAQVPASLHAIQSYRVRGAVAEVSGGGLCRYAPEGQPRHRVALLDYGMKRGILRALLARGCEVLRFPADSSAEAVLAEAPDGLVLSNGPGDPAENLFQIEQLRKLLGRLPLFGICLGHQLTALAAGGSTYKLKFGHRGANQPVRELGGQRTYITSQNHGYAVQAGVPDGRVSFVNANDGSCEGIDYPGLRAFTVQFHPEACAGPRDTAFLFDRFLALMEGGAF